MRRSNIGATLAKLALVLAMLAALFGILYVSKSRERARREELTRKREQYQNQIQSTLNENTFTVLDNPAENGDSRYLEVTDVLSGTSKGVVLVDPEHYKRNVRLTNFNETLDGSAIAELQRFQEEEVQEDDLLVLQFTAYTTDSTVDVQVTVGKEIKNNKTYARDEKIPGVYTAGIHVTSTPTTYYIPMTGFISPMTVLKLQTTSAWKSLTVDNLYLINYGRKQDAKQLKIGAYPDEEQATNLTGEGILPGDYSHCLVSGNVLYTAGAGTLTACDLSGNVLSQVEGMGQSGEMVLSRDGNLLVLSAKQNGLYLVDVSDPSAMVILSHHDTVESAAGLCINGTYVFVSCGYSGVEVVDISQPEAPRFVTTVRVEDAVQDCYVDGQRLYVGMCDEKGVAVFDLTDIGEPEELAILELDGACQTLFVENDVLYAATGMDSRNDCENDWGFGVGGGNALEIHDISDLSEPVKLTTLPLGGRCDLPSDDTWNLQVSDGYVYLTAMHYGMYVYDVSELTDPKLVNHCIYRDEPTQDSTFEGYLLNYDPDRESRAHFVHTDVQNGALYTAVAGKGIFKINTPEAKVPQAAQLGSYQESQRETFLPRVTGYNVSHFDAGAPVRAVAAVESQNNDSSYDRIYVACGDGGVVVLDGDLNEVSRYETEGSVQDIQIWNTFVYLAKGAEGVEICSIQTKGNLKQVGTVELPQKQSATSLGVVGKGQYLVVQTGAYSHVVLDIRSPWGASVVEIDGVSVFQGTGRMTRRNVVSGLINNRYVGIYGEKGIYLYGTTRTELVQVQADNNVEVLASGGMAATASHGIASSEDGYTSFSIGTAGMSNARSVKTPGVTGLHGKLAYDSNVLVNCEGHTGKVSILDITSVSDPLLVAEFTVDGNPDLAWVSQKRILIPCHNGGLLKLDNQRLTEVSLWGTTNKK